ncbi:MAG TPA: PAC2 family protein [Candidatus Acidoferrales bacterium]|nr:PAC2 family protein [Candidatus Acidoferrales bacterium]
MTADTVSYESRPPLKRPILVLAFAGWNDAGAAATTAVRYLTEQLVASKFASIDPEEFYDFSVQRPHVRLVEGARRQISWPSYDFYCGPGVGTERDFILGLGGEPNLRWRTFCDSVMRLARDCKVELIVGLGAYLDEVLYTRPVPLTGTSTDEKLMAELDLIPSRYQGPTGIVGVIGEACRKEAIPHASLWAALPHYLPATPNPRGALALVLRLTQWLGLRVDTGPLERAAADFQSKVNEAVNSDPNLSAFIRELKKREFEQ